MQHITDKYFEEMLASLQRFLKIDTVKTPAAPGAPFGEGNVRCLNEVLDLAREMGFETHNCDNYAGHADFGTGEEIFGVLGHLDVVPVTDVEWSVPPFSADIRDGYLYARGTVDDKGPMIACLYALKALKDEGLTPKKKIRMIFGCDEESGWACMDYYMKKFPMPQTGFSPDGDFPLINREKGLYHFYMNIGKVNSSVVDVFAGDRFNIVPDSAYAVIKEVPCDASVLAKSGVTVTKTGGQLKLSATGVSCHASYPQKGDNAAWKVLHALNTLFPDDKALAFAAKKLCADVNGVSWGLPFEDDVSGKITHNIGRVRLENGNLVLGIDIRFPVTFTEEQIETAIRTNSPDTIITKKHGHLPLFVPEESQLVQNLLTAYNNVTGLPLFTKAVGGATYARCLPCGVAFGPTFPDGEKVIHCVDERISLENLRLITKIYYEAIKLSAF